MDTIEHVLDSFWYSISIPTEVGSAAPDRRMIANRCGMHHNSNRLYKPVPAGSGCPSSLSNPRTDRPMG